LILVKLHCLRVLLPHAVNCRRFCSWCRQSVVFVCEWNISGTAERICAEFTQKTCDEFEGQGHQGQKPAFFSPFGGLRVVNVW